MPSELAALIAYGKSLFHREAARRQDQTQKRQVILPVDEGETGTEFEEKVLQLAQDGRLQILLANLYPIHSSGNIAGDRLCDQGCPA